ncbi:hypothetical protein EV424DRAFT_1576411 [Suillus variegatus]|nr:hypothetical protein EV424DRAFT_1576411 [Suillus variegatus]
MTLMTPGGTARSGFFDDALREANLRIRLSQSHELHDRPAPAPRQHTLDPFSSFWHSKSHGAIERDTQSRSRPLSWTRNLVSRICRRDGSDIQLREVEVPYTAGKPRNHHAKKKLAASSSRPSNTHIMQQHSATTKSTPSSQQLPPIATAPTSSIVSGTAEATGTTSHPHITVTGWCAHFVGWLCCMPIITKIAQLRQGHVWSCLRYQGCQVYQLPAQLVTLFTV